MAVFDKFTGIGVASGFKLQAKTPLDPRLVVDTIEDRDALVTENGAYEGMKVYVKADGITYTLKGTTVNDWEADGAGAEADITTLEGRVETIESELDSQIEFTQEEKDKLAGIAEGANKTTVDSALSSTSTNPVQNKVVNTALNGKVPTTRTVNGKALSANITLDADDVGAVPSTEKGAANGVAELDSSGKLPVSQLPDYVDEQDEATLESAKAYADSILGANDAMLFKGTIGTNGTVTALPATHEIGWTYKVITAGTYAGVTCEIGDMIICIADGTAASNSDWTVVQTNIDGAVTGPVSAVANRVAVFSGTTGKVIKDSGYTIGKSVPDTAVFTDTTYGIASSVSSTNGNVKINLTDSNDVTNSVSIKGTGATTVTTDANGIITVNSTNTNTTYTLSGTASTDDTTGVDTVTLTLKPNSGTSTTAKFVSGDHITIQLLDDGTIEFSVTAFLADEILLTGYKKVSGSAVAASDNVLTAIGKLEAQVDAVKADTSAETLATPRAIDGVDFDGSANISHYGTCSTAAATAAKTVNISGFVLETGARAIVKFTITNTAANPTLNVNATGAKSILYRGAAITAGYLAANRTYEFVYNGTAYELIGDVDTNTTYSAATTSKAGLMSAEDKAKIDAMPTITVSATAPTTATPNSLWFEVS